MARLIQEKQFEDLTAGKTTSGQFADGRISQSSVTQHQGSIDHDALTNFDANEHVDHSGVNITAGAGLTGGGNITVTRILDVGAGTGITVNANDIAVNTGAVDHDGLLNFVANEHIDHSGVTITGTNSVNGGGDITASRTLELVNDEATPGNNQVYGTDDSGTKGWYDNLSGFSSGQLWSDDLGPSGSTTRARGVVYQNMNNYPVFVSIVVQNGGINRIHRIELAPAGSPSIPTGSPAGSPPLAWMSQVVAFENGAGGDTDGDFTLTTIVPPQYYYRYTATGTPVGGEAYNWHELA